ncbi:hypothetical protein MKX03_020044, partial [Papaver bracteatum]
MRQLTGTIVIPSDPPDLDSVQEVDVEGVHHYWTSDSPFYHTWWKEHSFGTWYREGVTHVKNRDLVNSTRLFRPSHPPPDMMSQSYEDYPGEASSSELPPIDLRFPVYMNGELTDLVVPRPTRYPDNFDVITLTR